MCVCVVCVDGMGEWIYQDLSKLKEQAGGTQHHHPPIILRGALLGCVQCLLGWSRYLVLALLIPTPPYITQLCF